MTGKITLEPPRAINDRAAGMVTASSAIPTPQRKSVNLVAVKAAVPIPIISHPEIPLEWL
jgi:hypothetical protein